MRVETASVTSHGNSKQTEVILRSFMKKCPLGLIHNFPTGYKRHLYTTNRLPSPGTKQVRNFPRPMFCRLGFLLENRPVLVPVGSNRA